MVAGRERALLGAMQVKFDLHVVAGDMVAGREGVPQGDMCVEFNVETHRQYAGFGPDQWHLPHLQK